MGVYIFGIGKAVLVPRTDHTEENDQTCLDYHRTIDYKIEGILPGCYVAGKGAHSISFDANNSGAWFWMEDLCHFAFGISSQEVSDNRHRYKNKPFYKLIMMKGNVIGPITAAKLCTDFSKASKKAKKYYFSTQEKQENLSGIALSRKVARTYQKSETEYLDRKTSTFSLENQAWMWERYQDFQYAFRCAKSKGFVLFA